jgi:hypothetical protein
MSERIVTPSKLDEVDGKPKAPTQNVAAGAPPLPSAPAPAESAQDDEDPFAPVPLRLHHDFLAEGGTKPLLLRVTVTPPDKLWYIRVHRDPEYTRTCELLELKVGVGKEWYWLHPKVLALLPTKVQKRIVVRSLATAINRSGTLFLWPLTVPTPGRVNRWAESALDCYKLGKTKWVSMEANTNPGAGYYDVTTAPDGWEEPDWSGLPPMNELLKIAFKDTFIDTADHAIVTQIMEGKVGGK